MAKNITYFDISFYTSPIHDPASNILNSVWNISFPQALPTFYFDESEYANALQKRGLILRWTKPIDRIKIVSLSERILAGTRSKGTVSRDSDKKSRRHYEGGDIVSWAWIPPRLPFSLTSSCHYPARTLSRRETDGGLYYADSYYHQLNSYTTSRLWCSYVTRGEEGRGDKGRWCLVHDYSTRSRLTFSNGCSILYIEGEASYANVKIFRSFLFILYISFDRCAIVYNCFIDVIVRHDVIPCIFKIEKDCWTRYYGNFEVWFSEWGKIGNLNTFKVFRDSLFLFLLFYNYIYYLFIC